MKSIHRNQQIAKHSFALILILGMAASGCGGYRMNEKGATLGDEVSNEGLKNSLAHRLSPRIVGARGGEGIVRPLVPTTDGRALKPSVSYEGKAAIFEDVLHFSSAPTGRVEDRFIVWKESALGPQIVEAFYEHHHRDVLNREHGKGLRRNAGYDPETGLWYIHLNDALGDWVWDSSPKEWHRIRVDLVLADGTRSHVTLSFRISGPMPAVDPEKLPIPAVSLGDFLAGADGGGIVSGALAVQNPTGRDLRLWIGLDGQAVLRTQAGGSVSEVQMMLTRVRLVRKDRKGEFLGREEAEVRGDSKASFILAAGERVELEIVASAGQDTPRCLIPGPAVTVESRTVAIPLGPRFTVMKRIPNPVSVTGVELVGEMGFSMVFTETDQTPGPVTSLSYREEGKIHRSAGQAVGGTLSSCQGVYAYPIAYGG